MTTPQARQRAFEEAVLGKLRWKSGVRVSRAYGVSNSAKVVEGGLQIAVLNLDNPFGQAAGWVVFSLLRLAPGDEVLFALVVRTGLSDADERLAAMTRAGAGDRTRLSAGDSLQYSARGNNTVVHLVNGGRLLLRNRGFWDVLPSSLDVFAPLVGVDRAFWVVHREGGLNRGADEFVGWLGRLLGAAPFDEISEFEELTAPLLLAEDVRKRFEVIGGEDRDGGLERLHQALGVRRPGGMAWLHGAPIEASAELAAAHARAVGVAPRWFDGAVASMAERGGYLVVDARVDAFRQVLWEESLRRRVEGPEGRSRVVAVSDGPPPQPYAASVPVVFWRS